MHEGVISDLGGGKSVHFYPDEAYGALRNGSVMPGSFHLS